MEKPAQAPSWKEQGYLPARYLVAFMAFLGMVFNYMLRVNMNFAIVAMVKPANTTGVEVVDLCGFGQDNSTSSQYDGEFEWDELTQSLINGAFFWGYIWTQIPGGRLAEVMGARRVFGGAIAAASVLTLLIPVAAHANYMVLIAVRVLLGIAEGATFPSTHALLANWAPPLERSMLSTIIYAGSQAGTIITFPMSAAIIESLGWEAVFYIQAGLTMVWCVAWFLVVADNPENFRNISLAEKTYILHTIGDSKQRKALPVPWKSALTSLPFWAILVAGVGNNWGFYTLLTDLPLYMKTMLHQDIKANALLSGMPYLGMWIFSLVVSAVGDTLRSTGTITTTVLRKAATTIAHVGPAICLCCLALVECNQFATISLLFTAVTLQGGIYSGFLVNHIDIAPNFAGTLYGITNAAATIPGWLAPLTVGALTNNQQTFEQWRKVFFISAGIFVADALFYLFGGSGVEQGWNNVSTSVEQIQIPEQGWNNVSTSVEQIKIPKFNKISHNVPIEMKHTEPNLQLVANASQRVSSEVSAVDTKFRSSSYVNDGFKKD